MTWQSRMQNTHTICLTPSDGTSRKTNRCEDNKYLYYLVTGLNCQSFRNKDELIIEVAYVTKIFKRGEE
jgi:hypothetical protein